jgi:hypothetical protein
MRQSGVPTARVLSVWGLTAVLLAAYALTTLD